MTTAPRLRMTKEGTGNLSSEMQKLGFTDYEARIYIQLLTTTPATAYELSKAAGIPRSNAYGALENLNRRAAVQAVSEDPVRYVAVAPRDMLARIASSASKLCDDLAESLSAIAKPEDTHTVWTVWGEAAVDEKIRAMLDKAERHVWIKAADTVLRKHTAALRAAAERGTEILIVLFGEDADEFRFSESTRVYLHEGNGVRMGTADNLFTVTVDHEEALTANVGEDVFASYTLNRPIVTMAESLIRHDFYLAEIFARFGPDIEAAFGLHLQSLRAACFTPEQMAAFKERTGLD